MAIKKFFALFVALSVCACAIINTTPKMVIDRIDIVQEEQEPNTLGGVKNISDWFSLMPDIIDFDVNGDSSISTLEYYTYVKAVRSRFQQGSGWITSADEDASGFVTDDEWAKQVAKVRVNGDWIKVFDTNRDGVVSIDEEVLATKYIAQVGDYYKSIVETTATSWPKTIDIDEIENKYDADGSWSIDMTELNQYLTDNAKTLMFYYDWNGDGAITGIENDTAMQVIRGTFKEINDYLNQLKAQYHSNII